MNATLKSALLSATVLLVSSSAFASNMGFKLVYPVAPVAGHSGTNWVSLPYFNSFTTASTVFADIPNVVQVSKYVRASDTYIDYTGSFGDPDFPVVKGEAILVKVSVASNWTIVGSHDNAFGVTLNQATGGNSGTNWISLPYHTNKATVSTLFAEVPNVVQISHYLKATDTYEDYTGSFGDPDFAITIGEGLLVKVSATSSTWTPAHF